MSQATSSSPSQKLPLTVDGGAVRPRTRSQEGRFAARVAPAESERSGPRPSDTTALHVPTERWSGNVAREVVDQDTARSPFGPDENTVAALLPPASPRVTVVIPTYNEARNLPHVLPHLPAGLHEVIVVDGHSVDDTLTVARTLLPDVKIVMQNRVGKGNAMACGFAAATGDIIVMLDADGSADPAEIPEFVAALVDGADFAKGSRFAPGGGSSDITGIRSWGNRWLNRAANLLFGTRYTDLCYGYNAFWRYCLDALELDPRPGQRGGRLWGDGFEIETVINTRMAKAGVQITEVPSFELPRIHGESNLNTWRDGGRVLKALVLERLNGRGRRFASHGGTTQAP